MDKAIAAREILLLGAFDEARQVAARAGIEVIPLKGAALLEAGIYQVGERGMSDADLLLRPGDLPRFEKILHGLRYRPMPNSADAWVRPSPNDAPPAILDLHTGLWHIKNTEELFNWGLEPGPGGLALNLADLFLHAAAHPLLHHGEVTPRNLEDCARIALHAPGDGRKFWAAVARKAGLYGLRPVIWPVLERLAADPYRGSSLPLAAVIRPVLERLAADPYRGSSLPLAAGPAVIPVDALRSLEPRGLEKIKAAFFEKAAKEHSTPLEYLLPLLHRPGFLVKYAFPEKHFMLRRYGAAGLAVYLLRPLRLLYSVFRKR